MNRRGFALISILISLATTAAGVYVADLVLKDQLGIGVGDLVNFVLSMDQTLESAPYIPETYEEQLLEKGNITLLFDLGVDKLDEINNNSDVTAILKGAMGEHYTIYLFTVYNNTYKVFDWTFGFTNGSITQYESGMMGEPNVKIQIDQNALINLMKGQASKDMIKELVKEKQVKINPVLEVTRVYGAMPEIIRVIQEQSQALQD